MKRGVLVALLLGVGVWYVNQPHSYESCKRKYEGAPGAGAYCAKEFLVKPLMWRKQ